MKNTGVPLNAPTVVAIGTLLGLRERVAEPRPDAELRRTTVVRAGGTSARRAPETDTT
jgi:hypothetical protein